MAVENLPSSQPPTLATAPSSIMGLTFRRHSKLSLARRPELILSLAAIASLLLFSGPWHRRRPPSALQDTASRADDWRFTTASFPRGATCPAVARTDDFVPGQRSYPRPETKCRLMVVATGMPRSGSTLQMMLAQRMIALGPAKTLGAEHLKGRCYWDLHKHIDFEVLHRNAAGAEPSEAARKALEKHLSDRTEMIKAITKDDLLVVKTHEYKPELVRGYCRKAVVIATRRNLKNTVQSFMAAGWQVKALSSFLKASITRHECWKALEGEGVEVLEWDYDDLTNRPKEFLKDLVHRAGLSSDNITEIVIENSATQVMNKEANPQFPGRNKEDALSMTQLTAIGKALAVPEIKRWQEANKYYE